MDIGGWLRTLGLERYEAAFRENAIDADVLRDLTDEDLEKLGVLLGDRRRLLRAIAALDGACAAAIPAPVPSAASASPTSSTLEVSGEWRHVTAVFCDLVDLTGIAAKLDADEWRDLVGAYLDAASTAVTKSDGKVVNKLGDGLIALFGYPVAQENDLQRAAHASRLIQRFLAELDRKNDRKDNPILAARIAIDSGPMMIDAAGAIFGELPKSAEQVLEPITEMIATQQRQIRGQSATKGGSPELKSAPRALRANGSVPARGDGHSMSYHQLITRAVDELDRNTAEARRALYERARHALLAQLRSNKPVLVLADITRERRALEEAIGKVEADAARNLQTEPQELRSAAPPGRTPFGGAHALSPPSRRDRANPPSAALTGDGWPAVLFSARDRLLSVRSARRKQVASGLRDVVSDVQDLGTPETDAAKAADQTGEAYELGTPQYASAKEPSRSSREPHSDPDDLHSIDYGMQQQRGHKLSSDPDDEPVALAAQDTLMALELEEEQNDPSSRERYYREAASLPRPNWARPLPKRLIVSGVMTAATLSDVRVMIERHLPPASRTKEMWKYVSNELREAALGGDTAEFFSVLEMALSIEGLEWALK